jgi:DNA-binding cell septation regulator SpoVG
MNSRFSATDIGPTRITEVRFKPSGRKETNCNIVGYATVILNNDLFVGDVKVIERSDGSRFISFASKKVKRPCSRCHHPTALRDNFCSFCGEALEPVKSENGEKLRLHEDIVHPICGELRDQFEKVILGLVQLEEMNRTRGGYHPSWDYPFKVYWTNGHYSCVQSRDPVVHRDSVVRERYHTAH